MKVAISHVLLRMWSRKVNFDRIKKCVSEAKAKGAQLVLIPSMFNVGPFHLAYPSAQAAGYAKTVAEKVPGGMSSELLTRLASTNSVYILAGPIIERAGPRLFYTSILASPSGVVVARYRQIALGDTDRQIGVSPGRYPNLVSAFKDVSVGLLLGQDILYPEIARVMALMGTSLLISFIRAGELNERVVRALGEARSFENGVPLVVIGGALEGVEKSLIELPSMIIDHREGVIEKVTLSEAGRDATYHVVVFGGRIRGDRASSLDVASLKNVANLLYRMTKSKELKKEGAGGGIRTRE